MSRDGSLWENYSSQFSTPVKPQQEFVEIASPPGDKSLRLATSPINRDESVSPAIKEIAHRMIKFVDSCGMISLACNQLLGGDKNIFVFRVPDSESAPPSYQAHYALGEKGRDWNIVINGEYEAFPDANMVFLPEGSVSGCEQKNIYRWSKIKAKWLDQDGNFHEEILEGLAARIFQNKVCYLNGISIEAIDSDFQPPRNMHEIKNLHERMGHYSSADVAGSAMQELSSARKLLFKDEEDEIAEMGGAAYSAFPD